MTPTDWLGRLARDAWAARWWWLTPILAILALVLLLRLGHSDVLQGYDAF